MVVRWQSRGNWAGRTASVVVRCADIARELGPDDRSAFGPIVWIRSDQPIDERGQTGIEPGISGRERSHLAAHELLEDLRWLLGVDRPRPAQHLVENDAKGVEIRAMVHLVGADRLLGSHVCGGPHHGSRTGRHLPELGRCLELGDSEIEQLHVGTGREPHVVRLQIAVDHAMSVRSLQRREDLDADVERFRGR